jgi:cell division protein FtsZ
MTINLKAPELRELKPRIMVCGVGGAGGNAVNNMITSGLAGVDFIVANTDAQALTSSKADRIIQMGMQVTEGLGAGAQPEVGRAAAEEAMEEIRDHFAGVHMVFVTAGMGGGTGTGAAPVIARAARDMGILTVGVVTKPFQFEGMRRMRIAESGITELQKSVDTLIVIPNQNLFRVANEKTTFADAFSMADQVLYSGVACITDLMVKEGLINLDFADVRAIMREMGKAMMGTGEATGERRAILAAEAAIANPLLDETSMRGARGLLISITGGNDLTLYEVDEAASRIRQEVDEEANIILGATFDESLDGIVRVSVVATGIDTPAKQINAAETRIAEAAEKLRAQAVAGQRPAAFQGAPTAPVAPVAPLAPPPAAEPAAQPYYAEPAAPAPAPLQQAPAYAPAQALAQGAQDVQIEPIRRPAAYAPAPAPAPVATEAHAPHDAGPFVPPQAERVMRPPRMPTPEELPLPAQAQLAAMRGERPAEGHPEQKRRGLLERLTAFARALPEESQQSQPAPVQARPRAPMAPMAAPIPAPRPAAQPQAPHPAAHQAPHMDYARRPQAQLPQAPRQQQLDLHGRAVPARSIEDDHLEIPAFLRRQSS